jgi:hypothetical protein
MALSSDHFGATLGNGERWSTLAAVVLGLVGTFVLGLFLMIRTGDLRFLLLNLPFAVMLWFLGRYAPSGYRLAGDGVHVERRAGPCVIPYATIRAVDRAPRSLNGISVMGSKGVFGRFGRFWNSRLGLYRLYLTNRDSVVWLATTDGLVALSPDRPDEFLARLQARIRPSE